MKQQDQVSRKIKEEFDSDFPIFAVIVVFLVLLGFLVF